jgi:hypothetical protein
MRPLGDRPGNAGDLAAGSFSEASRNANHWLVTIMAGYFQHINEDPAIFRWKYKPN